MQRVFEQGGAKEGHGGNPEPIMKLNHSHSGWSAGSPCGPLLALPAEWSVWYKGVQGLGRRMVGA